MLARCLLFRVFLSLSLVVIFAASPAHAQFFNDASSAQLIVEPEYPAPHSPIEISLDAYTMNTTGSTILWYVDGVERTENRNERSLTLTTGDIGQKQVVTVKVTPTNGFTISVSRSIVPSEVDIILEADTYIPAFYQGRALPSGNATVRVIAIPHSLKNTSPAELTYEWKQGETVLFGGPVKGKLAALITMSRYEGDYLSVRVTNAQGNLVGGKTILLKPAEPEFHFYEENPLRGLSTRAITDSLILVGEETTLHAEPYYMVTDLTKKSVSFGWSVDGVDTSTDASNNHTLTLRKTMSGGSAGVEVRAVTTATIPQYVQKGFTIMF